MTGKAAACAPCRQGAKEMQNHRDAVLAVALGFAATSAVMVPPILAEQAARAERIAAHDAAVGHAAEAIGRERAGRLAVLLRNPEASTVAGVAHAERARLARTGR
jgi:hypothetical protein